MIDWRSQGQEKFLQGVKLSRRRYTKLRIDWEHDHCEFCGLKFSENQGDMHEGYATLDGYHWVCVPCYNDFKQIFKWEIVE